jgi:hypothetical protein
LSAHRLVRQEQQDEDQVYFNFINSIKSEATKSVYESYLKNFMDYYGLTRLSDLLKLDVQNSIIKYLIALREKGLSSNSISVRLNAIFHFYEMNDVVVNVINYLYIIINESLSTLYLPSSIFPGHSDHQSRHIWNPAIKFLNLSLMQILESCGSLRPKRRYSKRD